MKEKLEQLHKNLDEKVEEITTIHADGVIDGFGKSLPASRKLCTVSGGLWCKLGVSWVFMKSYICIVYKSCAGSTRFAQVNLCRKLL